MTIVLFILFDLNYNTIPRSFVDNYSVLKYVALILLPTISKNLSYTYVSKKMGYKPIIIFDLVFSLYPYIIPVLPNPSEYVMSIIYLLVPIFFAFRLVNFFEKNNDNLLSSDYHKIKFTSYIISLMIPSDQDKMI